jgi:uncharacterized protein YdcH (DUF465 family)
MENNNTYDNIISMLDDILNRQDRMMERMNEINNTMREMNNNISSTRINNEAVTSMKKNSWWDNMSEARLKKQ